MQKMNQNISGEAVISTLMSLLSGEDQEIEEKMIGLDVYQSRVGKALKYLRLAKPRFSQVTVTNDGRVALKVADAKMISNILEIVRAVFPPGTQIQSMAAKQSAPLAKAIESCVKEAPDSD